MFNPSENARLVTDEEVIEAINNVPCHYSRDEDPPFGRGETWYNGSTIDTTSLGGENIIGKTWVFEDLVYNPANQVGARPSRTNRSVKCMAVRNKSGVNLLPGQLIQLDSSSGYKYTSQFLGSTNPSATGAQRGYPVDEWLPSAGVAPNDICWVVVEGPAMCLTSIVALPSISVGDTVVAQTAAASTGVTGGRVTLEDLTGILTVSATGATTAILNSQNRIGWALSAVTTNNTSSNILVEVKGW